MKTRKFLAVIVSMMMVLLMIPVSVSAEEEDVQFIYELDIFLNPPLCKDTVTEGSPKPELEISAYTEDFEDLYDAFSIETAEWVTDCDAEGYVPFEGTFTTGEKYTAYFVVVMAEGYVLSDETMIYFADDEWETETFIQEENKLVFKISLMAEHKMDEDTYERKDPTCQSIGYVKYICAGCGEEIYIEKDIDPYAHEWGEWSVLKEPSRTEAGSKSKICEICHEEKTVVIPMLYTKVYEPETSWWMSATVAWEADSTVKQVAKEDVRPATVFVWLDNALKVYDRDGGLISDSVQDFVKETADTLIPAFYIKDADTASALKAWLEETGFEDCFVVSTPENKELVKDAADLLHVRGMLDYTSVNEPSRKDLTDMIASVNGAHGKVILINETAATRENIQLLQSLWSNVWVKTSTDTKTIVTLYTNGVNGVLVEDYKEALLAEELFQDDAPSLLRLPMIIGHRGDPSNYVENTLDSAKGAYEEGADSIENDIQLTSDGQLLINHNESTSIFTGNEDYIEDNTAETMRSLIFDWNLIPEHNEVNHEDPIYGNKFGGLLYGESEKKEYSLPFYSEYLEEFKGKNIVHDTEIKTTDPAILPVFKKLVDEYDAWDQVFTITFEKTILDALYADYPEISVGSMSTIWEFDPDIPYYTYEDMENAEGPEVALEKLYSILDRWNATYNPTNFMYGENMVKAGRHRGLSTLTWTYNHFIAENFAMDYMKGIHGLTTDDPWLSSEYIETISSGDLTVKTETDVPKPTGITKKGEEKTLDQAELKELGVLSEDGTEKLMIWRYKADMNVNGENYGYYYLYSNPFILTIEKPAQPVEYFCTKGDGNVWKKGSNTTCDFTFERSVDDNETFSHFTGIEIDGNSIDASKYHAESGSVNVQLFPQYLESLNTGEHQIKAIFDDGEAEASFVIQAEETKPSDKPDDTAKKDDKKPDTAPKKKQPDTSDHTNLTLWMVMLMASLSVAGFALWEKINR